MSITVMKDGTLDVVNKFSFKIKDGTRAQQRIALESALDIIKNKIMTEYDIHTYGIK